MPTNPVITPPAGSDLVEDPGAGGDPSQGGNFYWNFGRSPNNRTTIPHVDRFFYSDWSNLYPLGCGTIQPPGGPCGTAPPVVGAYENGMQFGGDYAPIVKIPSPGLAIRESGSTPGHTGTVSAVGGPLLSKTDPSPTLPGLRSLALPVRSPGRLPRAAKNFDG